MYSRYINKVTLEFILISLILHKAAAYSGSCIVKSTVQSSNSVMKEFFNFQLGCKIPCLKSFDYLTEVGEIPQKIKGKSFIYKNWSNWITFIY